MHVLGATEGIGDLFGNVAQLGGVEHLDLHGAVAEFRHLGREGVDTDAGVARLGVDVAEFENDLVGHGRTGQDDRADENAGQVPRKSKRSHDSLLLYESLPFAATGLAGSG